MVQQTTRCGHQHFNALFQLSGLAFHVHAAKNNRTVEIGVFGVELDLFGHLHCQLTGRQQHQSTHRVPRGRGRCVFVLHHALQQRQGKSGRLAGAGLRRAHHVTPLQNDRNGLLLNGCHGFVAHFSNGFGQLGGEGKIGKIRGHVARYCRILDLLGALQSGLGVRST